MYEGPRRRIDPLLRALDSGRFVGTVLAAAIVLRLAWIAVALAAGTGPVSDAAWYAERAAAIASGQGYSIAGTPTAYWPVGYPAFLGALFGVFGDAPSAGMIANALLSVLAMYLALRIARRTGLTERAARIALAILAVHPNGIAYASLLMSEPLFAVLALAGTERAIAAMIHEGRGTISFAAAGILFGMAALVKPQAIAIPAIVVAVLWWRQRRAGHSGGVGRRLVGAAAMYGLLAAVVLPWTLRNHAIFGAHGIISTNDGVNLLIGNNPEATGRYGVSAALERLDAMAGDEHVRNSRARAEALEYIASHPAQALMLVPTKFVALYRSDTEGFSMNLRAIEEADPAQWFMKASKAVAQLWWVGLLAAVVGALILTLRGRAASPDALWLAAGIVAYFTAIPLVYFGDGRFHFPSTPWLVLIASHGIALLVARAAGPTETARDN